MRLPELTHAPSHLAQGPRPPSFAQSRTFLPDPSWAQPTPQHGQEPGTGLGILLHGISAPDASVARAHPPPGQVCPLILVPSAQPQGSALLLSFHPHPRLAQALSGPSSLPSVGSMALCNPTLLWHAHRSCPTSPQVPETGLVPLGPRTAAHLVSSGVPLPLLPRAFPAQGPLRSPACCAQGPPDPSAACSLLHRRLTRPSP